MDKITRLLAGAMLAALLLGSAAVAVADDDDDDNHVPPTVRTLAATGVTDGAVTLNAEVNPRGTHPELNATTFRFEYGRTTSYGQVTPSRTLPASNSTSTVTAAVDGLTPGTVYHFRVRGNHTHPRNRTITGGDMSFTTAAAAPPPAENPPPPAADNPPATSPATKPDAAGTPAATAAAPPSTAAPEPVLGGSVLVAPLRGVITVKRPGTSEFVTLAAGDSVPVGTLVDTRSGLIVLTSSVGAHKTQSGLFAGGLFKVGQTRAGLGRTDIVLRGESFRRCPVAVRKGAPFARAATAGGRLPKRQLWARDKGGKFRTYGRNSVAAVRGTIWGTIDTCAGTRTRVLEGAVEVFDKRRGKTVLVRAGRSYLARSLRPTRATAKR